MLSAAFHAFLKVEKVIGLLLYPPLRNNLAAEKTALYSQIKANF